MTYVCPACKFMEGISRLNFTACKTRFTALLAIFQRAIRFEIYTGLSDCHMLTIISQNYAGSKHKSYKMKEVYYVRSTEQGKAQHRVCKGLKVAGIRVDFRSSD
jgi:hypothetical protein